MKIKIESNGDENISNNEFDSKFILFSSIDKDSYGTSAMLGTGDEFDIIMLIATMIETAYSKIQSDISSDLSYEVFKSSLIDLTEKLLRERGIDIGPQKSNAISFNPKELLKQAFEL